MDFLFLKCIFGPFFFIGLSFISKKCFYIFYISLTCYGSSFLVFDCRSFYYINMADGPDGADTGGTLINGRFRPTKRLGSGSFGEIFMGIGTNGEKVAIKFEKAGLRCPQLRHEYKVKKILSLSMLCFVLTHEHFAFTFHHMIYVCLLKSI